MAILRKGLFGFPSGRIGDKVYKQVGKNNIVCSLPKKSDKPASEKQMLQRYRFKQANAFLKPFVEVLNRYNVKDRKGRTPMNKAVSSLLLDNVGFDGHFNSVDMNKICLSRGNSKACFKVDSISVIEQGSLEISWGGKNRWLGNLCLSVFIYCMEEHSLINYMHCANLNQQQKVVLEIEEQFKGKELHIWALGESANPNVYYKDLEVTASKYLGILTIDQ